MSMKMHMMASHGTDGSYGHSKMEWHEVTLGPVEECWEKLQKLTPEGTAICHRIKNENIPVRGEIQSC